MSKKIKLFLVSQKDLIRNLGTVADSRLRKCLTNFIIQFDLNSYNAPKKMDWNTWNNSSYTDSWNKIKHGEWLTPDPDSYKSFQEFSTEQRFEDILDEFITGLLEMSVKEKSEFLKSLENLMSPIEKKKPKQDNIYNIINTIYYNHSDNDLFNSIKVSKLEHTDTIVLSSYNLNNIEKIKAKLIKEGIENIRYRIIKNPYNKKKIHTIMYDRIGEK